MSARTASRLDRLLPALTFDERLDGILAAYRQGSRPESFLLGTMPSSDNRRWNETVRVLNAVHSRLGWLIDYLEASVTQVELRLALADQQRVIAPLFEGEAQDHVSEMAGRLALRALAHLLGCWLDLRLIEDALAHLSERVGGRELLREDARTMLASCHKRLLALRERLADSEGFALDADLPEPTPEQRDEMLDRLLRERYLA